ncbi:methyltransferase domain-containing protein [Polynucleobacter sphagniphilus]|uniref:methyltransferase domain-containing protein n=1 Tax=Polynucleobacter sphagniphilus TaxID=1743169 RepID=UPI002475C4DC|nr:methyltransferase domain-containing protein [Polynucleobacter sphagniphilus]MDH6299946.1 ubiquinone/menaquinone biosynthesis C-methylase UbiE/adenylate kinase family enzyme [Polynucleobacter sphagniphilus]
MSNYQSFPMSPGASESLQKLKSLILPDLNGKTVLDLGCNSGFFSGYALFSGASKAVGMDFNKNSIDDARSKFPGCSFLEADFENIPPEKYDVVLLLSAIHYAADQENLIHSIMKSHLNSNGLLVLELGIVTDGEKSPRWKEIDRGIDKRLFANWSMLEKILSNYSWKVVSQSPNQKGDPTPRYVVQIRNKLRYVILLSTPPGSGKTSIAQAIFNANTLTVSLDELLGKILKKEVASSERLYYTVKRNFSTLALMNTYELIGQLGLYAELIQLAINIDTKKHLVIDGYIPAQHLQTVRDLLNQSNFFIVEFSSSNRAVTNHMQSKLQAEIFFESLTPPKPGISFPKGHIDKFETLADGSFILEGWATDEKGDLPKNLGIKLDEKYIKIRELNVNSRSDVKIHLNLPSDMVGFTLRSAPLTRNKPAYKDPLKSHSKIVTLRSGDTLLASKIFAP